MHESVRQMKTCLPVYMRCRNFALLTLFFGGAQLEAQTTLGGAPFDWNPIPQLSPGVRHAEVVFSTPRRMVVNILRVELSHPDIRLATTPRSAAWGQTFSSTFTVRTTRETCTQFLARNRAAGRDMVAAINAAPFKPFPTTSPYADKMGLAIEDGVVVSEQLNTDFISPSLVFGRDWRARFVARGQFVDHANVLTAVSGFEMVLSNGVPSGSTSPEPRTGIGLSSDKRLLFLLTVDGRATGYSEGAGTRELGELMLHFGAWEGMNMDGGGSTTMALYRDSTTSVAVANRQSDGSQRSVANHLGIWYTAAPEAISMDNWLAWRGVPIGLRNSKADPGKTSIPNALAYALNIDPLTGIAPGDAGARPSVAMDRVGDFLEFSFRRNRHAMDLDLTVLGSGDLSANSLRRPDGLEIREDGLDPLTLDPLIRARVPISGDKYFLRVGASVTTPPAEIITTGTVGTNFLINTWAADWASNFDRAQTVDVLTTPSTGHLAVGFTGNSFPDQMNLVLEKTFLRTPGDSNNYMATVEVLAARWLRDNHVAELSYSSDGLNWRVADTQTITLYSNQGGHLLRASIPMTDGVDLLFTRLTVRDTNDGQPDGSRIFSFDAAFEKAGVLGENFDISSWETDWAGQFESTQTDDIILSPMGGYLALGFAGNSWPSTRDFVMEKGFVRAPVDSGAWTADIQLRASRWNRGNHTYRIEVSTDGATWQVVASQTLSLFADQQGGHLLQASVPLAASISSLRVRVVGSDTNDWQPDGSRLGSLSISFSRP